MARIKAKDYEKLDDANIVNVIGLLESKNPITKKAACEILNINYNTARLNKIIDDYKDRVEFEEKRRKQLRGKPFDIGEIRYTIVNYLKGDSIAALARAQYRTSQGIKKILIEHSIPLRDASHNYWNPSDIPDEAVSNIFDIKELVWSARYNCIAEVKSVQASLDSDFYVYTIWVFGKYNFFALQPSYELGKLPILKELGVTAEDIKITDTTGMFDRPQDYIIKD